MADSSSFDLLSEGVQRWVYRQGWNSLRDIQEVAVPTLLARDRDVLITAPTAGGKTEAAFLPIISFLESHADTPGYGALCLSPLKALINDQFKRLEPLCESAGTAVTPWHGDVGQSQKKKSWKDPHGLLMITPESVEAMFIRRPGEMKTRLDGLQYIVIDEFHAFIGQERGQQLISLLSRIEHMVGRPITRVALSATIGDADMAMDFLRPDRSRPVVHLDVAHEKMALQLLLKGYSASMNSAGAESALPEQVQDLYTWLRGENHLVFANSRSTVEAVSDGLSVLCEANKVPTEFFAHHGSLSRSERHYVEDRLKSGDKPTTAVATSTLELGIDIGDVVSVGQIGAPSNVSSVRQRLGRSGRRDGRSAILRVLATSRAAVKQASPMEQLEVEIVQSIAVIELMLERWVEPPDTHDWHLSTMVQQVISMIAYRGGLTAGVLYDVLCRKGPWQWMEPTLFARVLRGMGEADMIQQLQDGDLVVGVLGEKMASSREIYTAFETPEQFRVIAGGRELGLLPIDSPLMSGQLIVFGGRRWEVIDIDLTAKTIAVKSARGGKPPTFSGEPAPVHARIRERMRDIYLREDMPAFLDADSEHLLIAARQCFRDHDIGRVPYVVNHGTGYWFVWAEDRVLSTLIMALGHANVESDRVGSCIEVMSALDWPQLIEAARAGIQALQGPGFDDIGMPFAQGKFDEALPGDLLSDAFKSSRIAVGRAAEYLSTICEASH